MSTTSPGAPSKTGDAARSAPSAEELLDRTAALVAIPSRSHEEQAIADHVESELRAHPWLEVDRVGDNVTARTTLDARTRVLVAGHLDTVPPAGNDHPRRDAEALFGIGACDMKGGLAVMLELAARANPQVLRADVTWCFYVCEEVAHRENGLVRLWTERPDLVASDAAILCEPTDANVEAGCQGTLRARVDLGGVRAHSARPTQGLNAIHRLAELLTIAASWQGRRVELDGCAYTEQLQAVFVDGGVAGNVVPDRASVTFNHRYAPDRDVAAALGALERAFAGAVDPGNDDRVELLDYADGAPPSLGVPLLAELVARSGRPARAKAGWTDVATMWAHGVPAANFGPGDPLLAHHPREHVTAGSVLAAYRVLWELLAGTDPPSGAAEAP